MSVVEIQLAEGACNCGCGGETVSAKSNFLPGHDQRLIGTLTRTHRAGDELVTIKGGKRTKTDVIKFGATVLKPAGMDKLRRYMELEPKQRSRSNGKLKVGSKVQIQRGRNTYDAVVTEVSDKGVPTEVNYTNKQGAEKLTTDFTLA